MSIVALKAVTVTAAADLLDSLTNPLSIIGWQGALRFTALGLAVLGLRRGFGQTDDRLRLFPPKVFLSRSTYQDLGIIVVTAFLLAIPATLWVSIDDETKRLVGAIASSVNGTLDAMLGASVAGQSPHAAVIRTIRVIVVLLSVDFATYCYHNIMHRVPWLWEFHKIHHSAAVLTPLTSQRVHICEHVLRSAAVTVVLGTALGFASRLSGKSAADVALGLSIYSYLFVYVLLLNHSHIWWSWGKAEYVLNSPAMHAIHHSRDPKHFNKNLGNLLSIWDLAFGTFHKTTKKPEQIEFGVDDGFAWGSASQLHLFARPFIAILQRRIKVQRPPKSEVIPDRL